MPILTLTTGYESMSLTHRDAIDLELCLNVTKVGRAWIQIGDALFNFGTNNSDAKTKLMVSEQQFNFLQLLKTKTWETCKDLSP